jgi:hypothetical protein
LGTAKTIIFLTNSLIIIWREGHFAHVARNLLLVEFTKIRGTQNFGRKQSYTYVIGTYFGKFFGLKKHKHKTLEGFLDLYQNLAGSGKCEFFRVCNKCY